MNQIVLTDAPAEKKQRTMHRDTFKRLRRYFSEVGSDGLALLLVCPACSKPARLELEPTTLQCDCTTWVVR